jgi:hypothetical protein
MQRSALWQLVCGFALASAAAAGCGGSDDAEQFVGTWHIDQASAAIACPGSTPQTLTPSGNVEFARGTTTALVAVSGSELDPFSFCDFTFDVKGADATIHGAQDCDLVGVNDAKFSPTSWTFTVTGANKAQETGAANVELPTTDPNTGAATTVLCQYSGHMALLTKVAK